MAELEELRSDLAKEEALAYIESLNNAKAYAEATIKLLESNTATTCTMLSKENAERAAQCLLELEEIVANEVALRELH